MSDELYRNPWAEGGKEQRQAFAVGRKEKDSQHRKTNTDTVYVEIIDEKV